MQRKLTENGSCEHYCRCKQIISMIRECDHQKEGKIHCQFINLNFISNLENKFNSIPFLFFSFLQFKFHPIIKFQLIIYFETGSYAEAQAVWEHITQACAGLKTQTIPLIVTLDAGITGMSYVLGQIVI